MIALPAIEEDLMGRRLPEGVTERHARTCRSRAGGRCDCTPTYQAQAWSPRDRRRKTKTFATAAAAKNWRQDTMSALRRGTLAVGRSQTLSQAAAEWLEGARSGLVRTRSGRPYKPSALRSYDRALTTRVLPALGHAKLEEIRRSDVQRLVTHLLGEGLDPSTVRTALVPLSAIYRRAMSLDEVVVNPTVGLELPAVEGRRERIAAPEEASALVEALPPGERALWATAVYAGLRRGELVALEWDAVDLEAGIIHVRASWDPEEGRIDPKSRAGRRTVPVASVLRRELLEHRMRQGRRRGLVFGRSEEEPLIADTAVRRARRAWKAAGLEPIGLHECRHTFASLMIAAGVNAKALSTFMGHASITITLDRYGHLFPGSEDEAAELLDGYLERAVREGAAPAP